MLSCLVYDFCRKVTTACDQHVNVIMSRVRLLSESQDSMWPTCYCYHVSCTTSVGKTRQHVTNMLMLSCLVYDFCRKVTTACDQHGNVIMSRVRLLSESYNSIWPTCYCYHVSCTTSVGKTRQHVTNMLMLSCLVYDFCWKVTTACDQHVNVIMSRIRLLSESYDSMWPTW
jgi:small nuclear ribonucleoprotein (snRNP)-like protein